jgi:hypothetical protein
MPYSVARYLTAPGENYGRGPAMNVLGGINVLNEEKKVILKQGHRAVDPILLMHDDGIIENMNLKPGSMVPGGVSAEGRPLVHTLPTGNFIIGKELMDDERMAINDAFLVTLFQILIETPQMTATEVLERAREKGALLSPTMGRYQSEGLGPMCEREFDLLMFQGLIPPPPQVILDAGAEYMVEYDAPLNRAMRAEEAAGGMRTFQWAAEIATNLQDPSVMDTFDPDVMIPELADINAMPLRWPRSGRIGIPRRLRPRSPRRCRGWPPWPRWPRPKAPDEHPADHPRLHQHTADQLHQDVPESPRGRGAEGSGSVLQGERILLPGGSQGACGG